MLRLRDSIAYIFLISFQVPMRQHKDCNFSYAGLKTQVRLAIESKNLYGHTIPSGLSSCVLFHKYEHAFWLSGVSS
jgi:tRNA A37 threonylcarbamoyltransferase TsaD